MGKQSGLGDNLYIAGYDVSGDIGSLKRIGGGPKPLEKTGINKHAFERIGGMRDGGMEYTAFFNPATDQAHDRLSLLPTTDQITTYCRGTALGGQAAAMVAKQLNYDAARGADGEFTFEVSAQSNGTGIEWGRQLTAGPRTDSAPGNGAGVDFTAASAFGLQAYLHVFALTGTSVTVTIQESSDDGAADAFTGVVGGAFGAATGITSQRITTSPTLAIERYLRVVTSGVFSHAVVAVMVVRNDTAVAF